jgi:hypothetical protein
MRLCHSSVTYAPEIQRISAARYENAAKLRDYSAFAEILNQNPQL